MNEKFDAYVLWYLAKKFQNWIVERSTARNFTVIDVNKMAVATKQSILMKKVIFLTHFI